MWSADYFLSCAHPKWKHPFTNYSWGLAHALGLVNVPTYTTICVLIVHIEKVVYCPLCWWIFSFRVGRGKSCGIRKLFSILEGLDSKLTSDQFWFILHPRSRQENFSWHNLTAGWGWTYSGQVVTTSCACLPYQLPRRDFETNLVGAYPYSYQ